MGLGSLTHGSAVGYDMTLLRSSADALREVMRKNRDAPHEINSPKNQLPPRILLVFSLSLFTRPIAG